MPLQDPEIKRKIKKLVAQEAWKRGLLEYKLDELQLRILRDVEDNDTNKVLILSSRQIGKSFWSCCYAIKYLLSNPGSIARIVAPTLEQAYDIVEDNLAKILDDVPDGLIKRKKSTLRWDFANGSSLRLGGLKRAHVDSNRGGNASLVIYEECGFVDGKDFLYGVNSVLGPQLLRSAGREIYVSTPSANPDHPLHTHVLPECESNNSLYRYTVFDSPSISPHMIEEAVRRSGGEDTEAFKREYMAHIIRSDSFMVVPFENSRHVANFDKPPESIWSVTIDWGGVRDRTVALVHTYDFANNKLMVWDEEHWVSNTPTPTIVEGLRDLIKRNNVKVDTVYADVPGQIAVDLNNNYDFPIVAPYKNDWLSGVNNLAAAFHADRVVIKPNCELLIRTCYAGMFNKNRTDFTRTDDLGHCDALAALMYALRSQDRSMPWQEPERKRVYEDKMDPKWVEKDNSIISFNSGSFSKRKNSIFG